MSTFEKLHNIYVIEDCGNDFSKLGSIESEDFVLQKISGVVNDLNYLQDFTQQDIPPKASFKDTLLWTGSWLGFFYDEKSKKGIFSTDYFGFGQIFYTIIRSATKSILIVGDSFRGIVKKRKDLAGEININWEVATPHLINNTNLFSTRFSSRTFAENINILHDNEILVFDEHGISIFNKFSLIDTDQYDYDYWLSRGISRATSIINNAGETGKVNEISLSGGKDSRALLGLILNSNNKEVTAYTAAPSGVAAGASREILEKDFVLACKLTEKYNIPWNTNDQFIEYKISYEEAVETWQNLRGNLSFDLRPKYSQVVGKDEIRFTGIGGELFRSYIGVGYKEGYPNWWKNAGKSKVSIRKDLDSLFKILCPSTLIDSELYKSALDNFVDSLDFGYGDDVISQLDINYRKYRSRSHSSVHSTHSSEGALLVYPLCLPEFVIASQKLSQEDQEGGKTLFDIIERTCPDLNTLDYASPPWPSSFKTEGDPNVWNNISGNSQLVAYKNMVSARTKEINKRGLESINFNQSSFKRLTENMDKLRAYSGFKGLNFFEGITKRVARAYQKNDQALYSLVSKTETLLDILQPLFIDTTCSKISISDDVFNVETINNVSIKPIFNENKGASSFELSKFLQVCEDIDMSAFKFTANIDKIKETVTVNLLDLANDCQVACYLYKNGIKVDQVWYECRKNIFFQISNYDEDAIYRVTVFFKWKNELHAQKIESLTLV